MRAFRISVTAFALVAICAGSAFAQDEGATITFTNTETLIYRGTGDMRAKEPLDCPITVGNLRITDVRLPSESNLDNVGLVIPFRGALSERMVHLDPRGDGAARLALICEVIDANEPIGFRMRTHARVRMFHSPGAWLELNLGRGPKDDRPIPAMTQNKRFTGEMHRWYVSSSIDDIYRKQDRERDRFAILLDTGERGSWWIKWLEIKSWPTALGQ